MSGPALYFPVSTFIAGVQKSLRDEWGYVWDVQDELLQHLNDATSEICNRDPQAVVTNAPFPLVAYAISIRAVGSGYAVGDTIVLGGGTFTTAIVLVVAGVNVTGGLDMVAVEIPGSYTAYPTSPVSPSSTSGAGTGATFNLLLTGPRQEIPPDGASLIKIRRNLGTDGQTLGPAITKVPSDDMDAYRPEWPEDVCGVNGQPEQVVHYITDERDPKRFYPWPMPNTMTTPWYVEMIYRSIPNNVGLNDAFPLPALYEPAAKFYVLAHVLLRVEQDDKRWAKAQTLIPIFLKMFDESLGATNVATEVTVMTDKVNRP